MSIRCDKHALSLYLDGELSPARRLTLEQHLRHCPECTREVQQLQQVDRMLMRWGTRRDALPPSTEVRILDDVERRKRKRPPSAVSRMTPAAVGSCIAAALLLVVTSFGHLPQGESAISAPVYPAKVQRLIGQRSAPLLNARRTSAILGERSSVVSDTHTRRHSEPVVN